jgi:hypothetical protein
MSVYCHLILNPNATSGQLTALGAAIWRWCTRTAGNSGIYSYLNNQPLTDLLAGRLPGADQTTRPAERWGVRFGVPGGAYRDRQALIDDLRQEIPAEGIVDVFVDGASWGPVDPMIPTRSGAGEPVRATVVQCEKRAAT